MRYQTRAVLAGAYLKGHRASLLTHSVDTENGDAPLCSRVKADSIADEFADDVNAEPTCITCRARDPRFNSASAATRAARPTLDTITAADGSTLKVATRITPDGLRVDVYCADNKQVPIASAVTKAAE